MDEEQIYQKYLDTLKEKLITKYEALGLRASGKYAEELESETTPTKMIMRGAFHGQFMESGRPSGGFPPISAIETWIENKKSLPAIFLEKKKQFAFLVARKIANEGITVPNEYNAGRVISEVIDEFLTDDIQQMIDEIGELWIPRITSDLIKFLKAA